MRKRTLKEGEEEEEKEETVIRLRQGMLRRR